jgi:hypothetical protein
LHVILLVGILTHAMLSTRAYPDAQIEQIGTALGSKIGVSKQFGIVELFGVHILLLPRNDVYPVAH